LVAGFLDIGVQSSAIMAPVSLSVVFPGLRYPVFGGPGAGFAFGGGSGLLPTHKIPYPHGVEEERQV
jgi:hypothetical protein